MIFKSMYSQLKSCVKVKNGLTQFFKCYIGARQGCVSSPIIFSLFINDLISYIKSECNRGEWKNAITTKQTFYNIMSSNAKSDILSVSKYLLISFSLRKELLNTV